MKKTILSICLMACSVGTVLAQEATYHLPKTAIKVSMLVEKKSYTPGILCDYARRFLKKMDVEQDKSVTYRMLDLEMFPVAQPDTNKIFLARIDQKHNIQKLTLSEDNILLGINADAKPYKVGKSFTPAKKSAPLDPANYLNQDILLTSSKLKMAELCSKEIYDIRESKNELTRGQADYMPKDGEQLRIMLQNLETQETAIRQLFEGVTVCDTSVVDVMYVPEKEVTNEVLFRFSKYAGVVDADNLSGEPYYVTVKDHKTMPEQIMDYGKKAPKDETGVWIALPGKISVSLADISGRTTTLDVSAAQFGDVENLNDPLFSKKFITTLILNPYNGGIEKIESTPVK